MGLFQDISLFYEGVELCLLFLQYLQMLYSIPLYLFLYLVFEFFHLLNLILNLLSDFDSLGKSLLLNLLCIQDKEQNYYILEKNNFSLCAKELASPLLEREA